MKKNLNEQIARIKSMMKSINESDFEMQKDESNSKIDELIKMAMDNFDMGELDPKLEKLMGGKYSKFIDIVEVPVSVDENTRFTAKFIIRWDEEDNEMGKCEEVWVEIHNQSDNLNDIADEINNNTQPSMDVLSPLYDKMNEYADESNQHSRDNEPDSMKSLGFRQSDFL